MKILKILAITLLAALAFPAFAQNRPQADEATVNAIKVKELTLKKESLLKKIAAEDAKRDQSINGVAAETQEMLNDRQDSVCLALRSQLVSVNLELKELTADKPVALDPDSPTTIAIINQFNELKEEYENSQNK